MNNEEYKRSFLTRQKVDTTKISVIEAGWGMGENWGHGWRKVVTGIGTLYN